MGANRSWSINPFALAALITGDRSSEKDAGREFDWARAKEMLETAFAKKGESATNVKLIFEGDKGTALLDLFQDLADLLVKPEDLVAIEQRPLVREAIQLFGEDKIRRVLPYLMPVADAHFAPPGAARGAENQAGAVPPIGGWQEVIDRDYVVGNISYLDPWQGGVADCYLISSMISLAWSQTDDWTALVNKTSRDYRYVFHPARTAVKVAAELPLDTNRQPAYARSSNDKEAWPGMFEKAYVMWACGLEEDERPQPFHYRKISFGDPAEACRCLVGGTGKSELRHLGARLTDVVRKRCNSPGGDRLVTTQPTMASTPEKLPGELGWTQTGLIRRHAYAVLGIYILGDKDYVVLRDPFNVVNPCEAHAKGTWKPGPGPCGAEEVELGAYGVFALPGRWFDQMMQDVSWV